MDNLTKAHTENKVGRVTFYIFEITGLVLACILFIMGIVIAIVGRTFAGFVQNFIYSVMALLIFFGLGRIIDLLYVKADKGCKCNHEEKEEPENKVEE